MTCVCGYYSDTTQWERTKSASRSRSYAPHPQWRRRRRRVSAGTIDPWGARSKPVRGVHRGIRGRRRRVRLFRDANRIGEYNARVQHPRRNCVFSNPFAGVVRAIINARHHIYIVCIVNWILLILAGT